MEVEPIAVQGVLAHSVHPIRVDARAAPANLTTELGASRAANHGALSNLLLMLAG